MKITREMARVHADRAMAWLDLIDIFGAFALAMYEVDRAIHVTLVDLDNFEQRALSQVLRRGWAKTPRRLS